MSEKLTYYENDGKPVYFSKTRAYSTTVKNYNGMEAVILSKIVISTFLIGAVAIILAHTTSPNSNSFPPSLRLIESQHLPTHCLRDELTK